MNRQEASALLASAATTLRSATDKAFKSIPKSSIHRVRSAIGNLEERVAKQEQSQYGWYDSEGMRQGGLMAFVRYFWHILEPETPFVDGWSMWAIVEHLEAVTAGKINRLLINVPPGFQKSMLTNIWWPAWEWGPMQRSHYRYVTFSYSASLTERDNGKFRDLVTSDDYRRMYGGGERGVRIRNKTTLKVHNSRAGWKLASSVGGVGTGERGDRVLVDDAHNVKDAESETVRQETTRWFRESLSSRVNNEQTAFVVIMQRVHEDDVSGVILSEGLPYDHLMIPMRYDWERQTDADGNPRETSIGWTDPRWVDPDEVGGIDAAKKETLGLLAWPERFSEQMTSDMEKAMGPYAAAGQLQQSPAPRGGGLFRSDWWQLWDPPDRLWPAFDYVVASLDSAFTAKEENDPSALTIWGTFVLPDDKSGGFMEEGSSILWHRGTRKRIMLIHAWRKHLEFSGPRIERLDSEMVAPGMSEDLARHRNRRYRNRTMQHWGLVEWVRFTCKEFKVHKLLIEAKASGISAAQELRSRYGDDGFSIELVKPVGDKWARAQACQATFSQLLVYAPEKDWSQEVINEMAQFPRGKHDDLTDSTTQAIAHLRARGLAATDDETTAQEIAAVMHEGRARRPSPTQNFNGKAIKPLYPV